MTERELWELGQLWEMRRSRKLEERDRSVYFNLLEKFYLDYSPSVSQSVNMEKEANLPGAGDHRKPKRLPLAEAMAKAGEQIGLQDYSPEHGWVYDIMRDICKTMAEIYAMDPSVEIEIGREKRAVSQVIGVLEQIDQECAEDWALNHTADLLRVRNMRAYLRTALYNSVSEFRLKKAAIGAGLERERRARSQGSFDTEDFFAAAVAKTFDEKEGET